MNYLALQNEVLSDRFDESKRGNAKNWLNHRYGRLWDMEDWTFKYQITDLSVSANSSSVARGTIGDIISVWDKTISPGYSPMYPIRPEDLLTYGSQTVTGFPYNFTVIGDTIYFERPMDQNRSFRVLSTIKFTEMSADGDTPLIPVEYHLTIAQGAASHGLRLENDPSWQGFEQDWTQAIEDMKKEYLTSVRTYSDNYPSWP